MNRSLEADKSLSGDNPGSRLKNLLRKIWMDWESVQLVLSLFIILLFAISPLFVKSPYYLGIIILTALYAYVGVAWNIAGGIAGQLLLGHITFFGLGAYTTILLLERLGVSPWIGIPAAAIPAALLGLFFSFLTLRYGLKLDYFALFTLAVMVVMAIIFSQLPFAGGAQGIWVSFRGESFEKMIFTSKVPYLYITLFLLLVGLLITYWIYRSKTGRYLMAIREDELAASCLGVNIARYKTIAVVLTAALEGIGGGVHVIYTTLVEPPLVFDLGFNVELIVSPLVGGLGTIVGPIIGALLNKPLVEILRGSLAGVRAGSTLIIYGVFLIGFILFLPKGITGLIHNLYLKLRGPITTTKTKIPG